MAEEIAGRQAERDRADAALRESEERLRRLNATLEERVAAAVADREASDRALREARKMQAVGQLAGGVAHDFNNLLTAVAGNLRQIRQRGSPELAPFADGIGQAVERGERLARQLLTFSRREPARAAAVDLGEAVEAALPLLSQAVRADTRVVVSPRRGPARSSSTWPTSS
jgi:signal transduction histidine kinase